MSGAFRKPGFEPSPAQLKALELDAEARAAALAAWRANGYFWLEPQTGSDAQQQLGRGMVVAVPDGDGKLAVVFRAHETLEGVLEDPEFAGLYFTVTAAAELWILEANREWSLATLEAACVDLVEVGRGLGYFETLGD